MDKVRPLRTRAFSLVELMMVIAILLILATVAVPAFNAVALGSRLNQAGQLVGDQMTLARQTAVTRNRETQVWFYKISSGSQTGWRGVQVWRVEQLAAGVTNIAASKPMLLPEGVIIDSNRSPLLSADASISGSTNLPALGNVDYAGFRIRPNGGTDLSVNASNNYVTLQQATGSPANYYTVQVNPITGKISVYRP